jgi:hypothetical protein
MFLLPILQGQQRWRVAALKEPDHTLGMPGQALALKALSVKGKQAGSQLVSELAAEKHCLGHLRRVAALSEESRVVPPVDDEAAADPPS